MGCCKSAGLQEKQVVAQRMLKQVHTCKDLLAGTVTTNNSNGESCLGEEIKTKGRRGKMKTLPCNRPERCWGSPDEWPSPGLLQCNKWLLHNIFPHSSNTVFTRSCSNPVSCAYLQHCWHSPKRTLIRTADESEPASH